MRIYRAGVAIAAIIASASGAQQPPMTVQQQFEAATTATAGVDKVAALAAWTALEKRVANNPRSLAVVRIRKSNVLLALDRKDEAAAAARAGLAALSAGDATLANDRFDAQFTLARIANAALDYASAAEAYRAAEAIAVTSADKLVSALGIAETDTFVDPAAADAAFARIDALVSTATTDAGVRGRIAMTRGVLLLNEGRFDEARKQSMAAVELYGGLTLKADLNDVAARSDTAIASMLAGDAETARKYMAYTGAGRIPEGSFSPAVQMTPPDCGGEAGLKPADMAVVEFSIGDDGSVIQAAPIYAAGGGAVALEFARATQRWSWTPEEVKQLPRFFRYRVRTEMRCSTGFTRPSINSAMHAAVIRWLIDRGVTLPAPPEGSPIAALPGQRAALADARGLAVVAASQPLLNSAFVPADEKHVAAVRALTIAVANDVPPLARLDLELDVLSTAKTEGPRAKGYAADLRGLLATQPYAADPRARAALKIFLAGLHPAKHADQQTRDWLHQVADDTELATTDPMKIAALLQIAAIDQTDGDEAAARAAYNRTGLTADQCALIDTPPRPVAASGSFPTEALVWGFAGWTLTQFDVNADGRVEDERAIISYPPFIFTKASVDSIQHARYSKSYRPDGGLGCGSATRQFRYVR